MSDLNSSLWREFEKDFEREETLDSLTAKLLTEQASHFPVRVLGRTQEGPLILTEEQRESHMHILGAPGQGKSKLLEMLIREDIENGFGACLLDPSDNGDTMYKVLRWCIKEGFEKVCIIDPHDIKYDAEGKTRKSVPAIAPRHNLMETVRILFGTKDASETPVIEKQLPSVFHALNAAGMTLAELVYFTDRDNLTYRSRRAQILSSLNVADRHRINLESTFAQSPHLFNSSFGSTIRRLEPFLERRMQSMFGLPSGIDFMKMISEGWLILCNLDYQGVGREFDNRHQRLIGTAVVNEIFYAISSLRAKGWKGHYYLYIDEVGDYATRNISTILDKKRKSGLRLTVAHQRFSQLEDQYVRDAVLTGTGIKFLFQTPNPSDVIPMARMMYGGDLPATKVEFVLRQLERQNAAVKFGKAPSQFAKLKQIPDVVLPRKDVEEFKNKIYNRDEWYHSPEEVLRSINGRFKEAESTYTLTPKRKRRVSESKPPRAVDDKTTKSDTPTDSSGPKRRSIFDDLPSGSDVLRRSSGRKSGKRDDGETEGR